MVSQFQRENEKLCLFLNSLTDGIYISNMDGITLWLNDASERMLHISRQDMIGKRAYDLETKGVIKPSITHEVIKTQNKVSTVQSYKNGRKFVATGHIIHNSDGVREYVLVHSRDITEAVNATSKLEEVEALLKRYSDTIRKMKLESGGNDTFIGKGAEFDYLNNLLDRVASVNATVMINGETGVGKTIVAQRIHQLSERHQQPFIHINCGAIPENLIESELFGYKEGAFTGANKGGKIGLVEMAHEGTLFLDEIGELPLLLQPKLLQVLQSKTFIRLGDTKLRNVDIRVIAATNNDLQKMVEDKKFRADLYYRLNVLPIHIKSLRERKEEIFPLLYFYLSKFNNLHGKNKKFSPDTLNILQKYRWPGNIRELENLVERLVVTSMYDNIQTADLPDEVKLHSRPSLYNEYMERNPEENLIEFLDRIEKNIIENELASHKTTRKTAEALGISQSLLMRRIKKFPIKS